jgi:uncharacterized protein YicC (UPF0701 family)
MSETTRTSFAEAVINLDTNKVVVGWKEDKFSSIDLVPGKELVFTESELTEEITRLQAEYDAQEYARNRASAYDSVGNQLDMLMKDMRDGTTTHKDACEAVKAKYPKPE